LPIVMPFDLQTNLYTFVVGERYGQYAEGMIYNIVRKPGQRLKKGETLKQLTERIAEDVASQPAHYFIRYPQPVLPEEQDAFIEEAKDTLQEMLDWEEDGFRPRPRFGISCLGVYGLCEYAGICLQDNLEWYHSWRFESNTKAFHAALKGV